MVCKNDPYPPPPPPPPYYCLREAHYCGWNGRQTGRCCDWLECQSFAGSYQMRCELPPRPPPPPPPYYCASRNAICGQNGRQTERCCEWLECQTMLGGGGQMRCQ